MVRESQAPRLDLLFLRMFFHAVYILHCYIIDIVLYVVPMIHVICLHSHKHIHTHMDAHT